MNTEWMPATSADPGTHTQAGLVNAIRASSQTVPRIVQSTVIAAWSTRRSRSIAVTAATATATATIACAVVRSPGRARGSSHAADAARTSDTTTGTTGSR